jgi:heavy metal sensor kinase
MFRSFRLRLALWVAGLGAVALSSYGVVAWWFIRDAVQDRLDTQLSTQIIPRAFGYSGPDGDWRDFDAELSGGLPGAFPGEGARILVRVRRPDGAPIFQSRDWFGALDAALPMAPLAAGGPAPSADPSSRPPHPPPPPPGIAGWFHWGRPPPPPPRDADGQAPPHKPPPIPGPPGPEPLGKALPSAVQFATVFADHRGWRVAVASDPRIEVAIAVDLGVLDGQAREEAAAFLLAIPAAMALLAIGAWLISHRALRPIRRLVDSIGEVTAAGLDRRVPTGRETRELEQLIAAFNAMLERLERSFSQASRFSADAAHELRTPLAILQGEIEHALQQAESGSDLQGLLSGLLDEVRRLEGISRKLLLLASADAGTLEVAVEPFALTDALDEVVEDIQTLGPDLDLTLAIEPGLVVAADPGLLRQVLQNLASNAIKYNLPRGWIRIEARCRADMVEVDMANASTGIRATETARIFDRFYRVDTARNRRIDGLGLGLSLAREIARAHRGDLVLAEAAFDHVLFRLTVPTIRQVLALADPSAR